MFQHLDPRTRLDLIEKVRLNGRKIFWIGIGLSVFSAVFPWLLILRVVKTTFAIGFLVYIAMVLGMGLSFIGLIYYNSVDLSD
jgi:hypothetical protein